MIYHLKAIATGKIEDLPYSTKRPMRSALNKTLFTGKMWLSKPVFLKMNKNTKDMAGPIRLYVYIAKKLRSMER